MTRVVMRAAGRTAWAAWALLAAVLPLSAQTPPAQPPAPAPDAAPAGPVRKITMDEAVRLALEQNLNLQVERLNPRIADENVAVAQAAWLPNLSSKFSYNNADSPPESFLSGSNDTLKTDQLSGNGGVQQLLPWGGSYSLGLDASRATSNNQFQNFNPRLGSNLQFSFSQPLLRNFSVDSSRQQLLVTRRNRDITDVQLRGTVVSTVRAVRNAYWNLKATIANLEVQQQSLDLARRTLRDNRTRVEVGTMAPIDIVEAESEVARNEEAVIVAEASIRTAEDQLRALIYDPASPDFWTMTIDPVDSPMQQPTAIDPEGAVRSALEKRTDLQQARKQLETVDLNLKYYRNQTLPQVNLQADYGTTGLGGREFLRGDGFPGPIIGQADRGLGSVLGDVLTMDFPTWTVGVTLSYTLGKNATEATYARTKIERDQAALQIRQLELSVGTEVRNVVRQVNTNQKRVEATRSARVLAERRLEAEQKKFGVGMSTSFLVFQAQRDLATARVNELSAILDYNKSLADYEAVQEASTTGSNSITLRGTTIQSTGATTTTTTSTTTTRQQ